MTHVPPDGITVRKAEASDSDLLLRLIVSLAEFEKLDPPDEAAQGRLVRDAFGPAPRFEVYLAEIDNEVAGYAFTFDTYSTFLAKPTLYLEDLFVMPQYRGQKVGYALMLHLANEAVRRDYGRMEWVVLDWNTHAQEFYKKLGARHLPDWFYYRLDREGLEKFTEAQ